MRPLPLCIAAFALTLLGTSCRSTPAPHDDAAAGPTEIQVVWLEHGEATALAATLRHLLESGPSGVRIAPVPDQNALALTGNRASLQTALELVARLDEAADERQAAPEASVIYLKHIAAVDMAETLNQFLHESREDIEITAHADSNCLLVRTSGERYRQVATLIHKLDKPQP